MVTTRIGILGLGRMGERLAKAAWALGYEVIGAYDISSDAYGFQLHEPLRRVACPSLDAFWELPLDAVAIATLGPTHCPLLLEGIARRHRRFLVEKPIGTSLTEARLAVAEAAREKVRIVVNHGRRYCSVYDRLRDLDGSDEMGPLAAGVLTLGAAGLGCMGTHFFDLFNRLLGKPHKVFALLTTPVGVNPRGAELHDPGGTVIIQYPKKRRAIIDMGDDVGVPPRWEFLYERGRVVIEDELRPWSVRSRLPEHREAPTTRYGLPLAERSLDDFQACENHYANMGALRDLMADGPSLSGPDVALAALEVYAAARWSAKIGAPVVLPIDQAAADAVYPIA